MDNWEALVQDYICLNRRILINSQYDIGGKKWKANADFLAVDFTSRIVWMVEVSISGSEFAKKMVHFEKQYKPRIEDQLKQSGIISAEDKWEFGIWLFPKSDFEPKAQKLLEDNEIDPHRVTPLEKVASDMLTGEVWKDIDDLIEVCVN